MACQCRYRDVAVWTIDKLSEFLNRQEHIKRVCWNVSRSAPHPRDESRVFWAECGISGIKNICVIIKNKKKYWRHVNHTVFMAQSASRDEKQTTPPPTIPLHPPISTRTVWRIRLTHKNRSRTRSMLSFWAVRDENSRAAAGCRIND